MFERTKTDVGSYQKQRLVKEVSTSGGMLTAPQHHTSKNTKSFFVKHIESTFLILWAELDFYISAKN